MMTSIKVVAVDDHSLILDAIRSNLHAHPQIELVATGEDGDAVHNLVESHRPHVLLLDQRMLKNVDAEDAVRFKPIPAIKKIRREHPSIRIIIISAWADPVMIRQVLRAGVSGYISKSDANTDIAAAINVAITDGLYLSKTALSAYSKRAVLDLTDRQLEVLASINNNPTASYKQLAHELDVSESTFKKHLTLAMKRLGVPNNKLAAIKMVETLGLV